MTRLIRKYHSGGQIVLSDHLRDHLAKGGTVEIDDLELTRRLREEAEARLAQADKILAAARRQAEKIIEEAEEQRTIAHAEAQAAGFEEGYTQGFAEGQSIGEQTLVEGIGEVQSLLERIAHERAHLLLDAEREAAMLAVAVAEKTVGALAQSNRALIIHTVNRALNELAVTGPFALRVHPDDAAYLEQTWHAPEKNGESQSWRLLPDPEIAPGGCVVICGPASVDARLSSQLKTIVNGLALSDYQVDGEEDNDDTAPPADALAPLGQDHPRER